VGSARGDLRQANAPGRRSYPILIASSRPVGRRRGEVTLLDTGALLVGTISGKLKVVLRTFGPYQTKEAIEMLKVSRDSASQRQDAGPVVDLRDELDGYTASFTSLLVDVDATPFMKGLPDDRCQCPHWGYVFKGKMTARYADRDEVYEAGDAFYIPPGHIPVENEPGTEFLWFSPSEELRTAEAVMMKNMQAMQVGSTP
jgi:hypothetical protein